MPTPRSRNFRNGFRGIGGRFNNYERSRGGLLRYRSRIPWWPSRKKPAAQGTCGRPGGLFIGEDAVKTSRDKVRSCVRSPTLSMIAVVYRALTG